MSSPRNFVYDFWKSRQQHYSMFSPKCRCPNQERFARTNDLISAAGGAAALPAPRLVHLWSHYKSSLTWGCDALPQQGLAQTSPSSTFPRSLMTLTFTTAKQWGFSTMNVLIRSFKQDQWIYTSCTITIKMHDFVCN